MSLGSPKSLVRIVAGLQDHLILLVCKTISSSWSARPVVHQSYLPADHDALVRTVAGLQDHLIFLVCKTISSSWSARPVVHQTYLLADHGASSRHCCWSARPSYLLGLQDHLNFLVSQTSCPSNISSCRSWCILTGGVLRDNLPALFILWQWPESLPRESLKGSWGGVCPEKKFWKILEISRFFSRKKCWKDPWGGVQKKFWKNSGIFQNFFSGHPPQGSFQNFSGQNSGNLQNFSRIFFGDQTPPWTQGWKHVSSGWTDSL